MLLGAESKSRKSWLTQDAGFCVAAGTPWLADENGENGYKTVQAGVHVIDLELNPSEMRFRFAKARGNRFHQDIEAQRQLTKNIAAYSFDGMNVVDLTPRIAEVQATVQAGDLVIVDCFYRLVPDGNETSEVAAMLETLKRFAGETQAGIILVDHFRKAGDDKASAAHVAVNLPASFTPLDAGTAFLAAAASGELAPDTAGALVSAAGTLARVHEIQDLADRLEALEKALNPKKK